MAQKKTRVELIREAVLSVTAERVRQNKGSTYPVRVTAADRARPKQLDTALASMAPGRPREEAAVLVDVTMMGSGKEGFLFMADGVYMGRSQFVPQAGGSHPVPLVLRYEELEEAGINAGPVRVKGDVGMWCILKTLEGKNKGGYIGTNAWFLALAVNAVLRTLRQEGLIPQKPTEAEAKAALRKKVNEAPLPESVAAAMPSAPAEEKPAGPSAAMLLDRAMAEYGAGNLETARSWFTMAANFGLPEAYICLAGMCERGEGGPVDPEAARNWYAKAGASAPQAADPVQEKLDRLTKLAEAGDSAAALEAAALLRDRGSREDLARALALAHGAGDTELTTRLEQQLLTLAKAALDRGDVEEAAACSRPGKELRLPDSAFFLADLVVQYRVKEDWRYEQAAELGSLKAMCKLGGENILLMADGLRKDPNNHDPDRICLEGRRRFNELRKWYLQAANFAAEGTDMALASLNAGRKIFKTGDLGDQLLDRVVPELEAARKDWALYGPPDLSAEAAERLQELEQRIEDHKDGEAMRLAAECYRKGLGTYRQAERAWDLYDRAAYYGDPEASCVMARENIRKERWELAAYYAEKAALKDYAPAWGLMDEINPHLPPEKQTHLPWRPEGAAPAAEEPIREEKTELPAPKETTEAQAPAEPAPEAVREEAVRAYNAGVEASRAERYGEALEHYRRAAELGCGDGAAAAAAVLLGKAKTIADWRETQAMLERAEELGCRYPRLEELGKDIRERAEYCEAVYESGHTAAAQWLQEGKTEEALKLLRLAVQLGSAEAALLLAMCYDEGVGVEKDPEEYVRLLRLAEEKGSGEAACRLCLELGMKAETAEEAQAALDMLQRARELGHTTENMAELESTLRKKCTVCQLQEKRGMAYALYCAQKGDKEEAIRALRAEAEQSDADADVLNLLSLLLGEEERSEEDRVEARKLAIRGAELGNADCAFRAARLMGLQARFREEFEDALAMAGRAEELGYDEPEPLRELKEALQEVLADELPSREEMNDLGLLKEGSESEEEVDPVQRKITAALYVGSVLQQNGQYAEALAAYEQAAQLGSPLGRMMAGSMYATGEGVEQDEYKGFLYIKQAAEEGCTEAYTKLAALYLAPESGEVPEDPDKARYWAEKALEAGHKEAQKILKYLAGGRELEQGKMAWNEWRWADAARHLEAAARDGSADAARLLSYLYGKGSVMIEMEKENELEAEGLPVPKSPAEQVVEEDEALRAHWMAVAADLGDVYALREAAENTARGWMGFTEDLDRAIGWAERLAEALALRDGRDEEWTAAEKRRRTDCVRGLNLYVHGLRKKGAEDFAGAEEDFRQAAELGSGDAAFAIAELYINGQRQVEVGSGSSFREEFQGKVIFQWLQRADELGCMSATIIQAYNYAEGSNGVEQNLEKARALAEKYRNNTLLADADIVEKVEKAYYQERCRRQVNEGIDYWNRKEMDKAEGLFRLAAYHGETLGQFYLAAFLDEEKPGRVSEMLQLYAQAAEKGEVRAQVRLAELYSGGRVTEIDIDRALEWAAMAWLNPDANDDQRNEFSRISRNWSGHEGKYIQLRLNGLQKKREDGKNNAPEEIRRNGLAQPEKKVFYHGENLLHGIVEPEHANEMAAAFAAGALAGDARCLLRVKELRENGLWPERMKYTARGKDLSGMTAEWLEERLREKAAAGKAGPLFRQAAELLRRGGFGDRRKAVELLQQLKEGYNIHFGSWDHRGDGVRLPIRWVVAKADKEGLLLISRYLLAPDTGDDWLSREFLPSAFAPWEQKILGERKVNGKKTKVFRLGREDTGVADMLWRKGFPPVCCKAALAGRATEPSAYGRLAPWRTDDPDAPIALDRLVYRGWYSGDVFCRPCIFIPF